MDEPTNYCNQSFNPTSTQLGPPHLTPSHPISYRETAVLPNPTSSSPCKTIESSSPYVVTSLATRPLRRTLGFLRTSRDARTQVHWTRRSPPLSARSGRDLSCGFRGNGRKVAKKRDGKGKERNGRGERASVRERRTHTHIKTEKTETRHRGTEGQMIKSQLTTPPWLPHFLRRLRRLKEARIAYGEVNDVAGFARHPALRTSVVRVSTAAGAETGRGADAENYDAFRDDVEVRCCSPPQSFDGETRALGRVPAVGEHSAAIRREFALEEEDSQA